MTKFSSKIADFFVREQVIEEADYEIYAYGLDILFDNTGIMILLITVGIWQKRGLQTVAYLATFCGLRRFCGGYHARTRQGCHLATYFSYAIFLILMDMFEKAGMSAGIPWVISEFICIVIIAVLAPVEHKNKPLTEPAIRRNKVYAIKVSILLAMLERCTYQILPGVSFAILAALIEVTLLMMIGRRVNEKRKNIL